MLDAFFDCDKFIGLEETFALHLEIFLIDEGGSSYQLEFDVVEGFQQFLSFYFGFGLNKSIITKTSDIFSYSMALKLYGVVVLSSL